MDSYKLNDETGQCLSGASRRNFLSLLTALGAGAVLSGDRSWAQSGAGDPRRIDVHHHFTPPTYLEFTRMYNQGGRGGAGRGGNNQGKQGAGRAGGALGSALAGWTLAEDMDDMDKNGTQTAILSLTTPGLWFAPNDVIRKVVRECNEYANKLRVDHPGRFGSFASIYPPDTEGSLKETEYALDTLKAEGIALYSNYRDKWLGHEDFNPVYEELNRRKAVVYVHPIEGACCMNLVTDVADTVIEYGADTTRTIASLIFGGSTTRYPDITWIFSHGGA